MNITTSEAAKIAHVDPSTFRRWAESGAVPSIKTPGGHFRFNRAYILSRFTPSPVPTSPEVVGTGVSSVGSAA